MHRIFTRLIGWLQVFVAVPCAEDPLATLSPREFADLPAIHPTADPCGC